MGGGDQGGRGQALPAIERKIVNIFLPEICTRLGVFPSPVPVLCLRPLRREKLLGGSPPAEKPGVGAEKGDGGAEGGQECVS